MAIVDLFTTPFSDEHLSDINNKELIEFAYKNVKERGQSSHLDLAEPVLQPLLGAIREHFKMLTQLWNLIEGYEIRPTQAWLNVVKPLEQTSNIVETHLHPKHFVACVYYPKAEHNCGDLVLFPPSNIVDYALPPKLIQAANSYNGCRFTVTPQTNKLISFPGWINHQVKENWSKNDRISFAFNGDIEGFELDNNTL